MKSKIYLSAAALAVVITTVLVFNFSQASTGKFGPNFSPGNNPNFSPERHQAMAEAMANGDYQAWLALMPGKADKIKETITEENFPKFAEAWTLMQAGDYEGAKAIKDELGLPGRGKGLGAGQGFGRGWAKGGGCHQGCEHEGFVDANNDGICDHRQDLEQPDQE